MLKIEKLEHDRKFKDGSLVFHLYRAKIPGGWLVLMRNHKYHEEYSETWAYGYGGATFVPDPNHEWDGSSID
ncbi:MAG TPA: hypothetical protein DC054_14860 [Blastocatellia bacterium]|nr:hypothetical protein [Blastocatellia bacterium]